ncbi:MAG: nuclear transport factor 2 family protein [Chloroflexi bacterium]|nr:nuclear transport factor 2 family protein [Chloroflexota bacterium]
MTQVAAGTKLAEEAIERTRRFSRAMVEGDAAALEALLAPDFTYTHKNARVEPASELIPSVRGGRRNQRMEFERMSVRAYPGATIVNGLAHLKVGPADRPVEFSSHFSAVWVQVDDEQRLAVYHSTEVPQA